MPTIRRIPWRSLAVLLIGNTMSASLPAAVLQVPADHPTIQAAIDASNSGDTVQIAPGLYQEHLLIRRKDLTLSGSPGATIQAVDGMPAILGYGTVFMVGIDQCNNVVLRGLTFDGDRLGESYPGFGYGGVVYHGSGGRVEDCAFHGFRFRDSMDGGFGWTGLSAINEVVDRTPEFVVTHCRFADNGCSIHLRGNGQALTKSRLHFSLEDNVIEGIGPTSLGGQVGIFISYGAEGSVIGNRITDHNSLLEGLIKSFGILAIDWNYSVAIRPDARPLRPVQYERNTLIANQWAIASMGSSGSQFFGNLIQGVSPRISTGIGLTGDSNQVAGNSFSAVSRGILLIGTDPEYGNALGKATDPVLTDNRFCEVAQPVVSEDLVHGVTESGSVRCPFAVPALSIEPATLLSFPAEQGGWILESAPGADGPWVAMAYSAITMGTNASVTIPAAGRSALYRLRQP